MMYRRGTPCELSVSCASRRVTRWFVEPVIHCRSFQGPSLAVFSGSARACPRTGEQQPIRGGFNGLFSIKTSAQRETLPASSDCSVTCEQIGGSYGEDRAQRRARSACDPARQHHRCGLGDRRQRGQRQRREAALRIRFRGWGFHSDDRRCARAQPRTKRGACRRAHRVSRPPSSHS